MKKTISPELYNRLTKLSSKKSAIDQFIKTIMAEGQRMMSEFNNENMAIWQAIQKETGVDLQLTDWAPSTDEPNTIIMIQQRYLSQK